MKNIRFREVIMKLRVLPLLLSLCAGVAHADESITGAYAGVSIGRATLHQVDFFRSDFEAHDTGFKALGGYRILRGLAIEAGYADYGEIEKEVRGVRLVGEIDAFSVAVVGMIPLQGIDLFGKAGFAAWDGTLSADRAGRAASENDIDPMLGLGVQYRNGRLAVRAEVEAMTLSFDVVGDDDDDVDSDWLDFISVGMLWSF
jgi:hypothetical protein